MHRKISIVVTVDGPDSGASDFEAHAQDVAHAAIAELQKQMLTSGADSGIVTRYGLAAEATVVSVIADTGLSDV
jgi:hypothetical protein